MPSTALLIVEHYFIAFEEKVARCRDSNTFCPHELMDAYSRFARLRDRYIEEQSNLEPSEKRELCRTFENDTYTQGMMRLRIIADHSVTSSNENITLRIPNREPIVISAETSAMQVFQASTVYIPTVQSFCEATQHIEIDHIE